MVVGTDKYPCDITYKCSCGAKFELMTNMDGFTYLPESFETQNASEMHQETIEAINDAKLGILELSPDKKDENQP